MTTKYFYSVEHNIPVAHASKKPASSGMHVFSCVWKAQKNGALSAVRNKNLLFSNQRSPGEGLIFIGFAQ